MGLSKLGTGRIGIGIDTGGTFTDAVVVELDSGRLLASAKSPTTHGDLAVGIREALVLVGAAELRDVEVVSLSTTLATNAVVEGKGSRVGLIVAVPDPATFALPADLPAAQVAVIAGAHMPDGRSRTPLDTGAAGEAVARMAGEVDAFAVSGYFSVANAEHEEAIRTLIAETCGLPVVCGHELSQQIGMVERATTAALNARLLPLVRDLLGAVRSTLRELSIDAPLMVVKGDGTLTAEDVARRRPVETVLSGPAASVVGACRLSGLTSALVADMGGTTTDIALVSDGMPEINPSGALVGGWRTRVEALDVRTVGLGGDSRVRIDVDGGIRIGPDRAIPLCSAAVQFPFLREELERRAASIDGQGAVAEPLFLRAGASRRGEVSSAVMGVLEHVASGVAPAEAVVAAAGPFVDIDALVRSGHLLEIAVTPTDILAATGKLESGDAAASSAGVALLASSAGLSTEELAGRVSAAVAQRLAREVAARALEEDLGGRELSAVETGLLGTLLEAGADSVLQSQLSLRMPLVAVGAPVGAWFPKAREWLDAELIIPEYAEVANAFGALAGRVLERASAFVKAEPDETYVVITPQVREPYGDRETALRRAEELAGDRAREAAAAAGASNVTVSVTRDAVVVRTGAQSEDVFVEATVVATAAGPPFLDGHDPITGEGR